MVDFMLIDNPIFYSIFNNVLFNKIVYLALFVFYKGTTSWDINSSDDVDCQKSFPNGF